MQYLLTPLVQDTAALINSDGRGQHETERVLTCLAVTALLQQQQQQQQLQEMGMLCSNDQFGISDRPLRLFASDI